MRRRLKIRRHLQVRIRQKLILRSAILCTIVTFCTIGGFIFYTNLTTPFKAYAVAKYYTMSNGEWSNTSIWSTTSNTGPTCDCYPTCNLSVPADIKHNITVTTCANFDMSGGVTVQIMNGGNLTVTVSGKFTISGGTQVNIASGDTMIVNGNLELSGSSDIVCNGYMVVYGNVKLTGGSTICGTGQGYYTGTLSGGTSGWCFTGILPIELVSFGAHAKDKNNVQLEWVTASEINNDYFTIERSSNGIEFQSIKQVPGAGNSTVTKNYTFKDSAPLQGDSYYRLKQTDYDGKFTYSNIEFVQMKSIKETINMYPNPIHSDQQLKINLSNSKNIFRVEIYSISGMKMLEKPITNHEDLIEIDIGNILSAGLYLVCIINKEEQKVFQEKLIVN